MSESETVHPPSFQRGEIGDAKLSAALRTLELTVKRKLDGVLQGNHLGLIPGPGSEPGESRTSAGGTHWVIPVGSAGRRTAVA